MSVDADGPSTPCGQNSCYHGGQCYYGSEPYCLCPTYYSGPNCTEFNGKSLWRKCACPNVHASRSIYSYAYNLSVRFHIICFPQCSGIDVCFCQNGGFYHNSYRSCYCPEGFSGSFCEMDYRQYLCKLQHASWTRGAGRPVLGVHGCNAQWY